MTLPPPQALSYPLSGHPPPQENDPGSLTVLPKGPRALCIPEILEFVFIHLLWGSTPSSLYNPPRSSLEREQAEPQQLTFAALMQARLDRPPHLRLGFLLVCKFWYRVGEPMLWRDVRWTDRQSFRVHERIWEHWARVRAFEFEFGGVMERIVTVPVTVGGKLELERVLDDFSRALIRPWFGQESVVSGAHSMHLYRGIRGGSNRLTHLTLRGLFKLETFLEAILPLVPELQYLDIFLRCFEWRDEIRLDKVLRTCPKLEYLSVDRNMIGRMDSDGGSTPATQFDGDVNVEEGMAMEDDDDEEEEEEEWPSWGGQEDSGQDGNGLEESAEGDGAEGKGKSGTAQGDYYRLTARHFELLQQVCQPEPSLMDEILEGYQQLQSTSASVGPSVSGRSTNKSNNTQDNLTHKDNIKRRRPGPPRRRPLALRTLKLKKVRMLESQFLYLIRQCPKLEEMDVFSTMYWSWTSEFIKKVAQACPRIRHLHLTTNYVAGPAHGPGLVQPGIVFHDPVPVLAGQEPPEPGETQTTATATETLTEDVAAQNAMRLPFDPVVDLIKEFPELLSYDARYSCFQDRALLTLQEFCPLLERLDLTKCREVSSKALDGFLRAMPALKYLLAHQILLRIEDLRDVQEQEFRNDGGLSQRGRRSRWWVCTELETLVIGIKNPERIYNPTTEGDGLGGGSLEDEWAADRQNYLQNQGGSSSSSKATHLLQSRHSTTRACTRILFEQLGRLRKLKRLELHGGRFDFGMGSPFSSGTSSPPSFSSSPSGSGSSSGTTVSGDALVPKEGSKGLGGTLKLKGSQSLLRMKNFWSPLSKGSVTTPAQGEEETFPVLDRKGKGKQKEILHHPPLPPPPPPHLFDPASDFSLQEGGLWPLAGLNRLRTFGMIWSNFPKLIMEDLCWMCDHWTSLEWLLLGQVPMEEWYTIRQWVRSRRPDIVVVFEH